MTSRRRKPDKREGKNPMPAFAECAPHPGKLVRLLSAPEGSRDWALGMRCEIQISVGQPGSDAEYIGQCLRALLRTRGWRLLRTARDTPFRSFLQFCRAPRPQGLGLTRAQVEAYIELPAQVAPADSPSPADEASAAPSPELDGAKEACQKLSQADRADLLRWLLDLED
jgi:hypothetical protein